MVMVGKKKIIPYFPAKKNMPILCQMMVNGKNAKKTASGQFFY